jgi:type I restriction enzyme S subunit
VKTEALGELCDFISGLWKGEKPPFVRVSVYRNTNFNKDGTLDDSEVAELDVEARQYAKRKLQYGDIILEKSGGGPKQPVGRVALFDKESGEYSLSNFTSALRIRDPKRLDFAYLHRFLFWQHLAGVTETMQKRSTGIRNLNGDQYKAIKVPLPPLPEQQRIVGILDEAFAGIATAKANAEKNLRNARALFESKLQGLFEDADGWEQKTLAEVGTVFGRGKSRHRPRNEPKLYDGKYPFIQTGDVRNADRVLNSYTQTYSEMGLAQSKLWPAGTVCITIAANIAETAILGFDACIPDSIIGLVVDDAKADNVFVLYLLQSFKAHLKAQGKGSAQHNINMGTFEEQRFPFPSLKVQRAIVDGLDSLADQVLRLESIYQQKLDAIDLLKRSLLHQAFAGHLAREEPQSIGTPFPITIPNISTTDLHAGILAIACEQHETAGRIGDFTHVKGEKCAHMIESLVGIDLGRTPVKDAAGPNDFNHLKKVEHRAKMTNAFDFKRVEGGAYRVTKLHGFDRLIAKARTALGDRLSEAENLLQWMLPMSVRQAEIVATVYAGWNNLLLDGKQPTDEEIVYESRENWHPDKLKIDRGKFFTAIQWMREQTVVPEGKGKRVLAKGK